MGLIPKNNKLKSLYPETTAQQEGPWALDYFNKNKNVGGFAIGHGMNGIEGSRRVVVNPYSNNINKEALLRNERLRHYFDLNSISFPIMGNLIKAYVGTPYEKDSINIGRTEAARYLSGDPSHHLWEFLKRLINNLVDKSERIPMYNINSVKNTTEEIYRSGLEQPQENPPEHNYDFTISEQEADALGYYRDSRGHRSDKVKKVAHPSHPSRGNWNNNMFDFTSFGFKSPNYTLFGLADGNQDPQAVLTYKGGVVLPEITVTPKSTYINNLYDNIKYKYK